MHAGRLAMVRTMGCDVDDVDLAFGEPLDFEFSPTGVALASDAARYLRGCVVMNHVVLFGIGAALVGVAWLVLQKGGRASMAAALGMLKMPGILIIPAMFLWPGTALAGASMLFFPGKTGGWAALGAVVMITNVAALWVLYRVVIRRVPVDARDEPDPRLFADAADPGAPAPLAGWKRALYRLAFGDDIWVTQGTGYFADMYGLVFDCYQPGCAWALLLEIAVTLCVAFLSAWKPRHGMPCNLRNSIITVLFSALFVVAAGVRPFNSLLDNVVMAVVQLMTAIAMAAMTAGIAWEADPASAAFAVAAFCLFWSAMVVMAKGVWDAVVYMVDVWLGRRSGARRNARVVEAALVQERYADLQQCEDLDDGSLAGSFRAAPVLEFAKATPNTSGHAPMQSLPDSSFEPSGSAAHPRRQVTGTSSLAGSSFLTRSALASPQKTPRGAAQQGRPFAFEPIVIVGPLVEL
eukprot:TRINITY_DN4964_c0_g3_i1.p1 TRINITY_DN4964_c0_g3~~TRINITY_DN4964_c0_g3_i1.p1  ORF type:complete len:535 (+),score=140.97 TRINITY_DN4964_c0_g3_i1:215-1606(+)